MHNHISYFCAAHSDFLQGITRLDKQVEIKDGDKVIGSISLREVLLSHLKTKEGRSVIAEIHQQGMEDPMVIVPNEAEVESILLGLNHQLLAFLHNYDPPQEIV